VLKYFTLTPAVNLTAVNYFKTNDYHYDSLLERVVRDTVQGFKTGVDVNMSTNLTTKLFGDYYFKTKRLRQIRHFVIPTVGITYHPNMQGEKLGYFREVQYDSLGHYQPYSIFAGGIYGGPQGPESGLMTYGLNNNFEAKVRHKTDSGFVDKKIVLLQNLGINGSYSLSAKELNWSPINVTGRTRVWKNIDLIGNAVFDTYTTDSLGNRINRSFYEDKKKLLRYVNSQLAVNAAFSPQVFAKPGEQPTGNWNFNITYNIGFAKNYNLSQTFPNKPNQQLNFNGMITVTEKWRLSFNSGYDFTTKNLSYTSFNLYRDLRCWEAKIDWVPFGFNKRYAVGINLKTASLRDVKVNRQRQWMDNL
jgi:hypothetical protein